MSSFLWIGTTLPFFHFEGNLAVFRHVLKIMLGSLKIASTHSFNIRMLVISWPWDLFESWLLNIWRMSISEKSQKVKLYSVSNFNSDGNRLLFGMIEHWLAKKESKIQLFSWKSVTYLLLWKIVLFYCLVVSLTVTSNTSCWSVGHTISC